MLNSVAFHSKTARAPAELPDRGKSSRDKGLIHGHRLGYCQAAETNRNMPASIVSSSERLANRCSFDIASPGMLRRLDGILE